MALRQCSKNDFASRPLKKTPSYILVRHRELSLNALGSPERKFESQCHDSSTAWSSRKQITNNLNLIIKLYRRQPSLHSPGPCLCGSVRKMVSATDLQTTLSPVSVRARRICRTICVCSLLGLGRPRRRYPWCVFALSFGTPKNTEIVHSQAGGASKTCNVQKLFYILHSFSKVHSGGAHTWLVVGLAYTRRRCLGCVCTFFWYS